MNEQFDVSVIISTYNRCDLLPVALASILEQDSGAVNYEVIVVDNNSTDRTRYVVESFLEQSNVSLSYIFEEKQGLSYARNAGIAAARAPIVAFTDDDVYVSPDWVANIKRIFDQHPEIGCGGGKVLPQWNNEPPSWLTNDHWTPLALLDYGDSSFYVNTDRQICLIGANMAFRREVFERIGVFAPELQRVKGSIGSMEDLEFELRFYRSGGQGLYEPSLVVTAPVEPERLTKTYHRRWHTGHGHFSSMLRHEETERASARLFDIPSHMYRRAAANTIHWLKYSLQRREAKAFLHETQLRFFDGFFRERRKEFLKSSQRRGSIGEIISFISSLACRKQKSNRAEES
jgi:glycosyltransferase involved in cell wall biosynthesis